MSQVQIQAPPLSEPTDCLLCRSSRRRLICRFKDPYAMYRCLECGLVYLNPRPSAEAIPTLYDEQYYSSHNLQYAQRLSDPALDWLLHEWEQGVVSKVERFSPVGRLLEVGCAAGLFLKAAQRRGWEVTGVEISEFAANFARERLNLDVRCGTLETVNLPKASFDVVSMFMVLEHVPDPIGLLQQVRELLRPDGIISITVPNVRCLEAMVFGGKWRAYSFPHHTCVFSPATVRHCIESAGLKVRRLETYRHLSNFVNPTSHNPLSTVANNLTSSNGKWKLARAALRWPYRAAATVVDRWLLLGEHLRVVAGHHA